MSRLNTRMRRWGVVLRIASRDARQTLGRTVTAVILISLPIIIAIGSLTFWDVTTSQRYQASSWLGHGTDAQAVTLTIEGFLQSQTRENRQLFLRRYYYGDSVRRLSGLFGLTENTVKSRLFRLRAGLRDALLKEGIAV